MKPKKIIEQPPFNAYADVHGDVPYVPDALSIAVKEGVVNPDKSPVTRTHARDEFYAML